MTKPKGISEATLRRVRDYAVDEPSFTCSFASWDLSRNGKAITSTAVKNAVDWLLDRGIVELIEDAGRGGKVYAYVPPKEGGQVHRLFPELDEARALGIGALRPTADGEIVPHTRQRGPSGKPGRDKARSARGVRVKRQRQGT